MRKTLLYIGLLFFWVRAGAQISDDSRREIDSIQDYLLQTKALDSFSIANAHYKIGELYRYGSFGDSAYYHYKIANKIYRGLNNDFKRAKTLYLSLIHI